jgi:hypothetical protein
VDGFVKPEQRLFRIFSNLSQGPKIKLSGTCTQMIYDKQTMPVATNKSVVALVKRMVSLLNGVSSQEFYMKTVENLYMLRDQAGNERYIIDFFIYDIHNYYTIRLLTDIVVVGDTHYLNFLNVQTASSPTLLNRYDVKFDSAGILLGGNMFHENIGDLFDQYYLKHFKVVGVSDTSIEYSPEDLAEVTTLNSLMKGYAPSSISKASIQDLTNKGLEGHLVQYLPPDQTTVHDPLFCQRTQIAWDSNGVPLSNPYVPSSCIRDDKGAEAKMNDPWFGPGLLYSRSSNDGYRWLKDPARGFIANNLDR